MQVTLCIEDTLALEALTLLHALQLPPEAPELALPPEYEALLMLLTDAFTRGLMALPIARIRQIAAL